MKVYRLYTENRNAGSIVDKVKTHFDSFTVLNGAGYWKKGKENAFVLELITEQHNAIDKLEEIAKYIKQLNKQETVFITAQDIGLKSV